MTKLLSFILLGLILISYQNCAKQGFTNTESSLLSKETTLGGTANNDVDDGLVEVPQDENDENDEAPSCNLQKIKLGYVCILEGSGNSPKLALNGSLVSNNSTPLTVCTTKKGCLEIASLKFDVVSTEYRGYCKNDKAHTVQLSESELRELIIQ